MLPSLRGLLQKLFNSIYVKRKNIAIFFHTDAMEEFNDDPNAFKPLLAREVPVISGTLNQRSEALQEWQKHFRMSRSQDLFVVFFNIMDFKDEWVSNTSRVYLFFA